MMMEEVFEKLRSLQDVLSRRIGAEKELEEIPRGLATQEELLSRLKKTFTDRSSEFEEASARIRDLKTKLFEAESSREHAEKQMDGISTQREYEALDKEIRDASEKEQQVRKDLQREERNVQEVEETVKRDEQMIKQIEEDVAEKRAFIESKSAEKRKELSKLATEEGSIVPGLDSEVVFKFERIIRSKQGLGIVPVKSGCCSGCHMILPAQFVNEVREGNRIIFCPYCSRILFFQETTEDEDNFFMDIESGGLADLDDFEEEEEEGEYEEEEEEGSEKESIGSGFEEE
jgi:predicted  nucleic acid-binding Zn-ribbon protein